MNNLPAYNLLFNRNNYDGKWYCFTREDVNSYFNNRNNEHAKIASGSTQESAFENWKKRYLRK